MLTKQKMEDYIQYYKLSDTEVRKIYTLSDELNIAEVMSYKDFSKFLGDDDTLIKTKQIFEPKISWIQKTRNYIYKILRKPLPLSQLDKELASLSFTQDLYKGVKELQEKHPGLPFENLIMKAGHIQEGSFIRTVQSQDFTSDIKRFFLESKIATYIQVMYKEEVYIVASDEKFIFKEVRDILEEILNEKQAQETLSYNINTHSLRLGDKEIVFPKETRQEKLLDWVCNHTDLIGGGKPVFWYDFFESPLIGETAEHIDEEEADFKRKFRATIREIHDKTQETFYKKIFKFSNGKISLV